ncbi:MAG: GIY-YIG nuclease family protein [Lachnospiraceae bacterium]|nr:GIY-YIG nuclease family protein [Lachnospiraceae bacterium]
MKEKQNITYILRCSDGTLYTGWTNHLDKRVKDHNAGRGARYTRGRGPVELAYQEMHDTKQEAMQREAQIKKMTRKEKEKLIEAYQKEKRN